eukprot:TRINITY_DN5317_c0_g1_i1.p1 TRINITY_DN5317_c0_g1~~TRINITY_DN5317_c0_g1_i1.p1  ORF type:complete len:172 (-),score=39.46 TRINITY_DN5317_c0_g1_i1:303-818(-)
MSDDSNPPSNESGSDAPARPELMRRLGVDPEELKMQLRVMEIQDSCIVKSIMSAGMGGAFGAMFGMFIGSTDTLGTSSANLTYAQSFREGIKSMGRSAFSYGKNFAAAGFLISGMECGIEKVTAQHSLTNGLVAGCVSGAILSREGGPFGMGVGCATFSAFTALFHYLQNR